MMAMILIVSYNGDDMLAMMLMLAQRDESDGVDDIDGDENADILAMMLLMKMVMTMITILTMSENGGRVACCDDIEGGRGSEDHYNLRQKRIKSN